MKKNIILAIALSISIHGFAQKADSTKTPTFSLRSATSAIAEPLIVIDGNKQYLRGTNSMSGIDPNNIESITILKDSSANTKYGPDGFAGVIEIKTKNGLAGIYNKNIDSNSVKISGKVTGLSIRPAMPNGGIKDLNGKYSNPKVVIRNLLQKDTDSKANPIYVVDGKQVTSIEHLDPNHIESINVLKDAAAESLYGETAKNGVVIITTKKPTALPKNN